MSQNAAIGGFEVLAGAKSLEELRKMESKARGVYRRYLDELDGVDVNRRQF